MAGEIFISYRRADQAWARLLHDLLKAEGVEAWYDAQVGPGQDWRLATAKALEASNIFVLLFSENAAQSSDIAKELAAATFEKKLIIPVRLENIAPKGAFLYELASRNWVNAFEDTEAKLAELARGLAHLVRTGARDESVLPFDRSDPPPRRRKSMPVLIAAAALVLALVAGAFFWLHAPTPQPAASRVAVLPFEQLSGGGNARAFADTISEQIIAAMSDVQVQTVSREDAKGMNGTDRDAAALQLGADFILSGSVQGGEGGLHATMHLDHASTHATVWSASYDQDGVATQEFQSQIAATASDIARRAISARRDDPAEMDDAALEIVLKLSAGGHTMTEASFLEQRELARALVARAPRYDSAYSDLAMVSALLIEGASPDEVASLRTDAAKAANQALAINPRNGEAYIALAVLLAGRHWAEREAIYRKGLAAAPNLATLQSYLAGLLSAVGRLDDGLTLCTTSHALDPQSPPKNANLAIALADTGHVAEALSVINRAAAIWPSNLQVWLIRFYILANFGRPDEARALLDSPATIPVSIEPGATAARRAWLDARKTAAPASRSTAESAIRTALAAKEISAAQGVEMLAGLGDTDAAFALARQGDVDTSVLFQPVTDGMRRDARFMPLAAQVGLVNYWEKSGKWPDFCGESGLPYDCRAAAKALPPAR